VARKFSIGGLCVCAGGLDIPKLTKTQLIYSVSRFNLGELGVLFGEVRPTKASPWRRDCIRVLVEVESQHLRIFDCVDFYVNWRKVWVLSANTMPYKSKRVVNL